MQFVLCCVSNDVDCMQKISPHSPPPPPPFLLLLPPHHQYQKKREPFNKEKTKQNPKGEEGQAIKSHTHTHTHTHTHKHNRPQRYQRG